MNASARCWRDVDTVLGNGRERGVGRLRRVPIQLHVDAARPLDHRIPPDRIGKRRDQNVRAGRLGQLDRGVHVGHEIAGALGAEGIRESAS